MQIIGSPAQIDMLDPAVKRFLDAAWSPPSTEPGSVGFRTRRRDFPEKGKIMRDAAVAITAWIGSDEGTFVFDSSRDAFVRLIVQEDDRAEVYRALKDAWNHQRDLGECQVCGNLFSPRKGRIAKFCSARCRMQAARRA